VIGRQSNPRVLASKVRPQRWQSQRPHASLAVSETLNHVIVQNRTLRAGMRIDGVAVSGLTDSDTKWTPEVDGGFVRGNQNWCAKALKSSL
jgi:hypothetical protein